VRVAQAIVTFLEQNRGIAEHNMQRQATLLAAVIGLIMTVLLSWLSFRYFESFFLNFKERWTVRPVESTLPPPAYAATAAEGQSAH
jgi:peptidoglycan/LPS O-acetylase OafA/YrhL